MKAREKMLLVIETLLEKKPLDKITVSEIVSEARICRKTFYRNFTDKYDLADNYFKQFFDETFGKIISGETFDAALLRYLEICEAKADILKNAYSSCDVNGLRNYDIESTRKTYEKFLIDKGADLDLPEMWFAVEIASRGGTDMVIDWLVNGMKMDKKQLLLLIKRTLPNDILKYLK